MAFNSCIPHPDCFRYFYCRQEYWIIANDDKFKAVLLAALEFFTNGRLGDMDDNGETGDPWIVKSMDDFSNHTFGWHPRRRLVDAMDELEKEGWVKIRRSNQLGKNSSFLLCIDELSAKINELAASRKYRRFGRDRNRSDARVHSANFSECTPTLEMKNPECTPTLEPECTRALAYKEVKNSTNEEELKETTKELFLSPSSQEETDSQIPETQELLETTPPAKSFLPRAAADSQNTYDLQESEPVCVFIENAYRQRSGRHIDASKKYIHGKITSRSNTPLRGKIESAERRMSREEFRLALWRYLDTDDLWLRNNKWPLGSFLKDPLKYASASQDESEQTPRYSAIPPATESAPEATQINLNSPLYYIQTWDTIVHMKTSGKLSGFTLKKLDTAIRDSDFQERFTEVCEKTAKLIQAGQDYDFAWLFGGYVPNWQCVLEHKFDWQLPKLTAMDLAMIEAEREDREKLEKVKL